MLAKSVETVLKLSDFYTITTVRWQYTPHIHALYISPFAQSIFNFLNFKLSVEGSTQPQPLQDILLQF